MKKKVPYLRIAFKANEKRREKMRFDEDHLPSNNISNKYLFSLLVRYTEYGSRSYLSIIRDNQNFVRGISLLNLDLRDDI